MNAHPFGRGGPPDWEWHRRRLRLVWAVQVSLLVLQFSLLAVSVSMGWEVMKRFCP